MSFLTRTILRSRAAPLRLSTTSTRPFHVSAARAALSESDHNDDERKQVIDEHKEDQLEKQRQGKGHWKKELSSNSESALKADSEGINDAEKDIEKMQKQTSETLEEDHEHGKK